MAAGLEEGSVQLAIRPVLWLLVWKEGVCN